MELLYDLVFVVLIGQAAAALAQRTTWAGLGHFAVVFALIWIAWLNGSMHQEGHGRADGRSRNNIFGQMTVLVVLAVYTKGATDNDGQLFAITYTVLLCWIAWQWNQVRRHDVVPLYRRAAGRYIAMLLVSIVTMGISAIVGDGPRFWLWVATVAANTVVPLTDAWRTPDRPPGLMPTESMAERFSLLAVIVTGEVVVGVVNGVNSTGRGPLTILTAFFALGIGFGYWWIYFDLLGRRPPRPRYSTFVPWVLMQLPLTAAIAASGAGIVGVVQHADFRSTPSGPGWLLAGSSAAILTVISLLTTRLEYPPALVKVLPQARFGLLLGALSSLAVGAVMPEPWLLTLLLALVHQAVWWTTFISLARRTDWFTDLDGGRAS